jgi:hypothetical protein
MLQRLKRRLTPDAPLSPTPPHDCPKGTLAGRVPGICFHSATSGVMFHSEAGVHRTFIAHVERQVRNISLDNIERIAHELGLQAYELLMPLQAKAAT